jgi:pilus assembly protein CpaE
MSMNVLLVASDPSLAEMLRACGMRVTSASGPALAELARAGSRAPELLVVDHRGGGPLPEVLSAIRRQHPAIGLLVVLSSLDGARVLEAMRAGVSECLPHPVLEPELREAIGRIQAARPAAKKGEVYAFIGAKGGVGATTVAVNVATTLAKTSPGNTMLADMHMTCGDAAVLLGVEPRFSAADAFQNMHRLDAAVLKGLVTEAPSGVQLLASSEQPVAVRPDVAQTRTLIELAATQYAHLVLDVPRTSPEVLDALEAAGTIVLVINQELSTVRTAARLSSALQQRYGRERLQLVVNRFDERAEITQRDVERVTGLPVSHLFPNQYAAAAASQTAGRPLVLESGSKLSASLKAFTRAMAGLPEPETRERVGLFARIGRPATVKG